MRLKSLAVMTAAAIFVMAAPSAFAQTGCPTSGSGVTCFGGQYFCAATGMCKVPVEACPENQVLSCGACGCACPAGTTVCGDGTSANYQTCIINRSCPSGMTWDVCNDACVTPFVLLAPGAPQTGNPRVNGTMSLSGNLWAGDDVYMSDGKAIRVDGAGVTSLYLGNWDADAEGFSMSVDGDLYAAAVNTNELCLSGDCLNSWPGVSDYTAWFVDATGDVMSGTLRLTAPNSLVTSGRIGIGTASPTQALDVFGTAKMTGFQLPTGAAAGRVLVSDASGNGTWQNPSVTASGSLNRVAKFTGASSLGDSVIYDNGNLVGIGTTTPNSGKLHVSALGSTGVFAEGQTGFYGTGTAYGVRAVGGSYGAFGTGTIGLRGDGTSYGVYGETSTTNATGIYGVSGGTMGSGNGVLGLSQAPEGAGVYGINSYGYGVRGYGTYGIYAEGIYNYIGYSGRNNGITTPALTINNPAGGSQTVLSLRNNNVANGNIRADNSGNLVLSATNVIYLGYPDLGVTNNINFMNGGMYLNATGLGIGTTGPGYKLDVAGAIRSIDYGVAGSVNVMVGDDAFFSDIDQWGVIGLNGAGDNNVGGLRFGNGGPVIFGASGNLGIGTTSPGYKLTVLGNFYASTSYTASGAWSGSDVRWKKDIETVTGALDKVEKLRGVTYNWRKDEFPDKGFDDARHLGLIAQEVEPIVPEVIHADSKGFKMVSYENLTALLVEAVKELNDKVSHRGGGEMRKECTPGADCRCDDGWYVIGLGGQETPKEIICRQL